MEQASSYSSSSTIKTAITPSSEIQEEALELSPFHALLSCHPSIPNLTTSSKTKRPRKSLLQSQETNAQKSLPRQVIKMGYRVTTKHENPALSRYLLSDTAYFDGLSDYDPVFSLVPVAQKKKTQAVNDQDESSVLKPVSSSSRPKSPSSDQVHSQASSLFI